jgi:hypothetical protein
MLKRILLILAAAFAAAAAARPAKAIEALADVACVRDTLCTDDSARLDEATALYEEALNFVSKSIAPLKSAPLIVFCSKDACYRSFGFRKSAAESVGGFCIVVGPHGWKPYYVRHEMIHRLQVQQLGAIRMYLEPQWFVEGMAYSLSEDPRTELVEPFQTFRSRFESWYAATGKAHLWAQAAKL